MPEPLSMKIGLGMKVTVLPYFFAVFLVTYLYQSTLSAIFTRVSNRMSISVWPAEATSWWWTSIFTPTLSRFSTISDRRSWWWSAGATGKYPCLARAR